MFKLWSETNPDAKKELNPDLGLRDWDELEPEEKQKIWHYLKNYFESGQQSEMRVLISVVLLNEKHKALSYGKYTLEDRTLSASIAQVDFRNIFLNENKHAVLELLSIFADNIISERQDQYFRRGDKETEEQYKERKNEWIFQEFDKFKETINDIFKQFGINLIFTRSGFIYKQSQKITDEIYEPVINYLSDPKWKDVNRELKDAFGEYQLGTEKSYSNSITHAVSTVQAFLQILVNNKIGSSEGINYFIKQAQEKDLIPNDIFSNKIFKDIDSILMKERGKTGDAHPKQEYAKEKTVRLLLNLVMVFLQHCIQK